MFWDLQFAADTGTLTPAKAQWQQRGQRELLEKGEEREA